ncbi:MAG TPA: PhnD/SsuA/transferrin family substrate-binding protein, partial [Thermoanaerobaculia bacterium]|nr:PhnD/SsuA/transferrin family substrate-binding protein [Thermoanaerobaculia bacterium]
MWIETSLQPVVRALVLAAITCLAMVAFAQDADPVAFIYPAQDKDLGPDNDLMDYLRKNTTSHIRFEDGRRFNYQDVITDVLKYSKDGTRYVARLTPYAYVAAELQGADFEVLATYVSKATGTVTYHSYLVVRGETAGDPYKFSTAPTQRDVIEYLEKPKPVKPTDPPPVWSPRTFVYHDKFSTSSYFVPSVFFRANRIFNTAPGAGGTLNPITVVERSDKKSSELIRMVANREADIAAVWDGTKKSFESDPKHAGLMANLRFIEIPTALPNDLLVCSKNLPLAQKEELRAAIRGMKGCSNGKPAFGGADSDFACWMDIGDAGEASKALVGLRREAIAPPASVTVRIRLA